MRAAVSCSISDAMQLVTHQYLHLRGLSKSLRAKFKNQENLFLGGHARTSRGLKEIWPYRAVHNQLIEFQKTFYVSLKSPASSNCKRALPYHIIYDMA